MNDLTHVRLTRAFEGPRHDRLEKLWVCIAEYAKDRIRLIFEPNIGARASHAKMFQRMWAKDSEFENRFLLLTEMDFLPELAGQWLPVSLFEESAKVNAVATQYYTRNPNNMRLVRHAGKPGGWWVLVDKTRAPAQLEFEGRPDPCNQLPEQMPTAILPGIDCYPNDYGVEYAVGKHLFWSRHYHEGEDNETINGVQLGKMRKAHDRAVSLWIRTQPADFLALVARRCPEVI